MHERGQTRIALGAERDGRLTGTAPDLTYTPDPDWLAEVGRQGWAVLTRDQRIRHRPNELRAVREARLHVFALTSGNLTAAATAEIVIAAWPAIARAAADNDPPML